MTLKTMTLQSGSKFHVLAMALMVTMTLLRTSHAFTFQSTPPFMTWHHHRMKKPLQGTTTTMTTASPTKPRCTQQILLMSSIINQKPRKCSAHDHSWQQRYLELKEFYQVSGHTNVPQKYPDNPQLGRWVDAQRTAYKNGKLSAERIRDLEDIDFNWGSPNTDWEQRYLELKEFYQKFGNTDVPQTYPTNPQLGRWVDAQRSLYKRGELSAERIRALEEIGFHWGYINPTWEQRYLELKEFYQKVGHTNVPRKYPANPQLGLWVQTQRAFYKKGKLSADQIRAMEDIGFQWVLHSRSRSLKLKEFYREKYTVWEQRYLELKEFYQQHGHTNVPRNYPDNPLLGEWVHERRVEYKNGKLTAEHKRALVDLDFKWALQRR